MKYILGIETAEYPNDVALIDDQGKLLEARQISAHEQTVERLGFVVRDILYKKGKLIQEVGLAAICLGPGSYTGLRAGLAFLKGFCQFRKIPLVGVNSFEALKYGVSGSGKRKDDVKVLLDARNERVYTEGNKSIVIKDIAEVLRSIKSRTFFIGSGAREYREIIKSKLGDNALFGNDDENEISAEMVARKGFDLYRENVSMYSEEYLYKVKPLYILPPNITKSRKLK